MEIFCSLPLSSVYSPYFFCFPNQLSRSHSDHLVFPQHTLFICLYPLIRLETFETLNEFLLVLPVAQSERPSKRPISSRSDSHAISFLSGVRLKSSRRLWDCFWWCSRTRGPGLVHLFSSRGRERGLSTTSYLTHRTWPFAENQRCHFSRADLGRGPPVSPHSSCLLGWPFQFSGPCWHSLGWLFLRGRQKVERKSCGPPFTTPKTHAALQTGTMQRWPYGKLAANRMRNWVHVLSKTFKSKLRGGRRAGERQRGPLVPTLGDSETLS